VAHFLAMIYIYENENGGHEYYVAFVFGLKPAGIVFFERLYIYFYDGSHVQRLAGTFINLC